MHLAIFSNDDLVEIIRLTYQEKKSSRYIADVYGCGKSTIGDFLRKETYTEFWETYEEKPVAAGYVDSKIGYANDFKRSRLVFTSAQNNTYVHSTFLKTLENYCEHNNAQLVVGTFHYNKNGFTNLESDDIWFDPKIRDYICNEPMRITEGLVWCGELNISPTAVNPLSGLFNYTPEDSAIVPHTKMQLESIPTPKYCDPKMMYTTGTITQRNYIQKKTGQKAEFHHTFSALVVEIDEDGDWFVRQLNAESETGCFFDLDNYYTPTLVTEQNPIEAINYGDIHTAQIDRKVERVSWGSDDSILDNLKPKYQFIHDVLDQRARNHHNLKDPHFLFKTYSLGVEDLGMEVATVGHLLSSMQREEDYGQVVVVESNHDLALLRWLKEANYKSDPVNAIFFLELQLAQYKAIAENDEGFNLLEYAVKDVVGFQDIDAIFLKTDESFKICNTIECGQHGDKGNNGARGSTRAFQMQGLRFNIGHQHSCSIKDGVFVSGVSGKLDMGYNTGGSSWSQSHILTYTNGKRTIITLKNGKWRG